MSPTIFLTGASGYIGGTVLSVITEKHPEWTISALVRDDSTAAALKKHFPSVNYVIGALDSHDVIKNASASADVVLNMASSDDIPAVQSILEGLSQRPATANRYLIHTSGTGMLADFSTGEGNLAPRVWSDVKDVKEITSLDHTHFHRDVDEAVIDGGIAKDVNTAILSPPTIYGVGLGPLKKRSIQVPALIAGILSRGKGFTVGKGENVWDAIHVSDVASAYIFLVEEALKGEKSKAAFGPEGYYFVKDGDFSWKSVSEAVSKYAVEKNLIRTAELDSISGQEAAAIHPWAPLIWGSNARTSDDRLRALGWKAEASGIFLALPSMIDFEAAQKA